jgi:hypothetical protein
MIRITLLSALSFGLLLAANLDAAAIGFEITSLGGTAYRYTYFPAGLMLQTSEQVDILFDPTLYGTLSNGVAPPGFELLLFQPNNPQGALGHYSALALINNPSLAGTFGVDFTYAGSGTLGSQPFFINQEDSSGNVTSIVASGSTTPLSSVPEPASIGLLGVGVAALGWKRRKRLGASLLIPGAAPDGLNDSPSNWGSITPSITPPT